MSHSKCFYLGMLSIFSADDPLPGTLSLEGTKGSFTLDNPAHAKLFPPQGGTASFIVTTITTIITRTITVVKITSVTTTIVTFSLVPVAPTSTKAAITGSSGLSLQGTLQLPSYPGAEASFTPSGGDASKIKEPVRIVATLEGGCPPISGTIFLALLGQSSVTFIPDMSPPMQAMFYPATSPTAFIRGTYTEPTAADGAGSFSLLPGDASKVSSTPTLGTLVKMSGSDGDGILGVFIPGDSSGVALFKPDVSQRQGGGIAGSGGIATPASGSGAQQGI